MDVLRILAARISPRSKCVEFIFSIRIGLDPPADIAVTFSPAGLVTFRGVFASLIGVVDIENNIVCWCFAISLKDRSTDLQLGPAVIKVGKSIYRRKFFLSVFQYSLAPFT